MKNDDLIKKAQNYLDTLCNNMANRSVGREQNKKAVEYVGHIFSSLDIKTEYQEFKCIEWYENEVTLKAGDQSFNAYVSPYTLGCDVNAVLKEVATVEELEKVDTEGAILLMRGEITKEQLMPKNFVFYNPSEHQKIYRLLEEKNPIAIITATEKNPQLAGSLYPFPMIEDGDFDIPSVYMKDTEGEKLKKHVGENIQLEFESKRIPSSGSNVIAKIGEDFTKRIVITAHIDSKENTPGALDNGSGVVVLMLLAELLKEYKAKIGVELIATNGEDYYAASGHMKYLEVNNGKLDNIVLAINIDGAGHKNKKTEYSFYEFTSQKKERIKDRLQLSAELIEGEPWLQSDHMIFVMNGAQAIAFTSANLLEIASEIAHTPKDTPDLVDCRKLVYIAEGIKEIIDIMNQN